MMNDLDTDLRCDACFNERRDHIYRGDVGLVTCPIHPWMRLLPLDAYDDEDAAGF